MWDRTTLQRCPSTSFVAADRYVSVLLCKIMEKEIKKINKTLKTLKVMYLVASWLAWLADLFRRCLSEDCSNGFVVPWLVVKGWWPSLKHRMNRKLKKKKTTWKTEKQAAPILRKTYLNPDHPVGFAGAKPLNDDACAKGVKPSTTQKWLESQLAYTQTCQETL